MPSVPESVGFSASDASTRPTMARLYAAARLLRKPDEEDEEEERLMAETGGRRLKVREWMGR